MAEQELIGNAARDLMLAWRGLRRSPGFAATVILTLALGIGGTTGVFSVVNAVMFRPLAGVAAPEQLVALTRIQPSGVYDNMSVPDYIDYRDRAHSLRSLAAHCMSLVGVTISGGTAQRVRADLVTGNFFTTLGVRPELGRLLRDDDDGAPGTGTVAVLGDAFWRRAFGADAGVVGRTVLVDGTPFEIVGVAPPAFSGTRAQIGADLWVPLSTQPHTMPRLSAGILHDRAAGWIQPFGRLRDGATVSAVRAELSTISAQLAAANPVTDAGRVISAEPGVGLFPDERDEVSGVLRLLLGVVALVLLIACANVSSLLLVRLASRQREMATRLALGATRSRLVAQSLIEGAALAIPGGALGFLLASAIARLASATQPPSSILRGLDVSADGRVLIFALGASLLTGMLVAVLPAIHASHVAPMTVMKEGGRGFAQRRSRAQYALVVGQVALSLVALSAAAMFLRGLLLVVNAPAGFETRAAAMVSVDFVSQGYSAERGALFYDEAVRQLRAVPGAAAASVATTIPPNDYTVRVSVFRPGEEPSAEQLHGQELELGTRVALDDVAPGYFDALRIPIETGRDFNAGDRAGAPGVAIINQELARRLWPGQQVVGRRISWPAWSGTRREPLEIVGIAADSKVRTLTDAPPPMLYVPLAQNYSGQLTFIARGGDPARLLQAMNRVLAQLEPAIPLYGGQTMAEHVAASVWQQRMAAQWVIVFGLTALVLCVLGLYGVVAHSMSNRTREISVRLALGATQDSVVALVVRDGMRVAAVGLALGAIVLLVSRGLLTGLVEGVGAIGTLEVSIILTVLALVMTAACYVPARRAARLNPADALRED